MVLPFLPTIILRTYKCNIHITAHSVFCVVTYIVHHMVCVFFSVQYVYTWCIHTYMYVYMYICIYAHTFYSIQHACIMMYIHLIFFAHISMQHTYTNATHTTQIEMLRISVINMHYIYIYIYWSFWGIYLHAEHQTMRYTKHMLTCKVNRVWGGYD